MTGTLCVRPRGMGRQSEAGLKQIGVKPTLHGDSWLEAIYTSSAYAMLLVAMLCS